MRLFLSLSLLFVLLNIVGAFSQPEIYYCDNAKIDALFDTAEEVDFEKFIFNDDALAINKKNNRNDFLIGFMTTFLAGTIYISIVLLSNLDKKYNAEDIFFISLWGTFASGVAAYLISRYAERFPPEQKQKQKKIKNGALFAFFPFLYGCIGIGGFCFYYQISKLNSGVGI